MRIGEVTIKVGDHVSVGNRLGVFEGIYEFKANVRLPDGIIESVAIKDLSLPKITAVEALIKSNDVAELLEEAKKLKIVLLEHGYDLSVRRVTGVSK